MYSRGRFWVRFLVIALVVMVVCSAVLVRQLDLPSVQPSEDILQPGDIIFVDLYKGWCAVTYWDHMAVYVGGRDVDGGETSAGVVEATYSSGVVRISLWAFLRRDEGRKMAIRRLKDVASHEEAIQKAVDYALAQVGKPFDFTATATVPWKVNAANLHCAEVIWRAYKAAGIDLDFDDGLLLYPDDIYYSSRLTSVGER